MEREKVDGMINEMTEQKIIPDEIEFDNQGDVFFNNLN